MEAPNNLEIGCVSCRAFQPQTPEQGLCRRNPPQCNALIVMAKSIQAGGLIPQMQVVTSWPTVKNHEGCLEYEPVPPMVLSS